FPEAWLRFETARNTEANCTIVVVGRVELKIVRLRIKFIVRPGTTAQPAIAGENDFFGPFLDVGRLIVSPIVTARRQISADRCGMTIRFAAGVLGIAAAGRQFGDRHIVATSGELPVSAGWASGLGGLMVSSLIPFVVARNPEARAGVARDCVGKF